MYQSIRDKHLYIYDENKGLYPKSKALQFSQVTDNVFQNQKGSPISSKPFCSNGLISSLLAGV